MITEDYVSFETAKLLKENGFDEPCHALYHNGDDKIFFGLDVDSYHNTNLNVDCYACPTIQMAMKWLREVHNLEIYPFHDAIQENNDWWYRIEHHSKGCSLVKDESDAIYKTYEQACEAGIKYCLENLI